MKSVEKLLKENNRREDYKSIQEDNKITANMLKDKFNRMEQEKNAQDKNQQENN